jgi:hypothetical protein
MENHSGTLRGINKLRTELIFDESEFSIQRNLTPYSVSLVLSAMLIGNLSMSIYNNLNEFPLRDNPEKVSIYIYLGSFTLLILLTSIAYFPLMKYRKKNRNVYKYESIDKISVVEINDRLHFSFEFIDNSKDEIKLSKNESTQSFIENLRSKNVKIVDK